MRGGEEPAHGGEIAGGQRLDRGVDAGDLLDHVLGAPVSEGLSFSGSLDHRRRGLDEQRDAQGLGRLHAFAVTLSVKAIDERMLVWVLKIQKCAPAGTARSRSADRGNR